jgi:hypothetical protein
MQGIKSKLYGFDPRPLVRAGDTHLINGMNWTIIVSIRARS